VIPSTEKRKERRGGERRGGEGREKGKEKNLE
jgi:hypothetical protein